MTGSHLTLLNCTVQFLRGGIQVAGSDNVIENALVSHSDSDCVDMKGTRNRISNCIMENAGIAAGLSLKESTAVPGSTGMGGRLIIVGGNSNTVERSTLNKAADQVIHPRGRNLKILYNKCSNAYLVNHDTGVINAGFGDFRGTEIAYNWVWNDVAPTDINDSGIYLDGGGDGWTVHHNVVWNCSHDWKINVQQSDIVDIRVYNNTWGSQNAQSYNFDPPQGPNGAVNCQYINNTCPLSLEGRPLTSPWALSNNYSGKDPGYVDAAKRDYRPAAGSPLINVGTVIPGITDNVKDGKPDIGAYEHGLPNGGWEFYPPGASGRIGAPGGR
jgi:hypothetical protein